MFKLINDILAEMRPCLNYSQELNLKRTLISKLEQYYVSESNSDSTIDAPDLLNSFLSAKRIEGCSEKTLVFYKNTIDKMHQWVNKKYTAIRTEDIREYLTQYENSNSLSKVTVDNTRRILSSFFTWLEDEDYILKNPVRRIKKIRIEKRIKDTFTDEELEIIRDASTTLRDLALIDLLFSTGMRVGEVVALNRNDIDFNNRECTVFGKGKKERIVYFDARTKIHLEKYLLERHDNKNALFLSNDGKEARLGIGGVESMLKKIGKVLGGTRVFPHKFRRTLATIAIDKGMPVEQLQCLLGHQRIDTTLQYAMVKQSNVKLAHRRYLS